MIALMKWLYKKGRKFERITGQGTLREYQYCRLKVKSGTRGYGCILDEIKRRLLDKWTKLTNEINRNLLIQRISWTGLLKGERCLYTHFGGVVHPMAAVHAAMRVILICTR